jgi:hypothetical protein
MTFWIEADDFTLADAARLERITFWNLENAGAFAGSVMWQIYADNGTGRPGNLLSSGLSTILNHVTTGFAIGNWKEFVTTFDIIPLSLPRGTYWLALHNGPLSNSDSKDFFWETTGQSNGFASQAKIKPFDGPWYTNAFPGSHSEFAFRLEGASAPRLTTFATLSGGAAEITFTTIFGYIYSVEYNDNLAGGKWMRLPGAEIISGSGDVIRIMDPNADIGTRPSRLYRAALSYDIPVPVATFELTNSKPRINFTTTAGYYYRVEYTNNLDPSSWKPVAGAETILGTGEIIQIQDLDASIGTQPRRFYRVILF